MVSTLEGCNDNSHMTYNQHESTKKPTDIKALRYFSETLYIKHKTAVCRIGAAKENNKAKKNRQCVVVKHLKAPW